jgi:hypothetical protein
MQCDRYMAMALDRDRSLRVRLPIVVPCDRDFRSEIA